MPEIEDLGADNEAQNNDQTGSGEPVKADDAGADQPELSLPLDPTRSMRGLPEPFDDEDEDDDEDIDETLTERLIGLTEMFPESVRNASSSLLGFSIDATKWIYSTGRVVMWVAASSAVILALPVMFENERAQVEEQQMQQQRQLLLGPNAGVSGAGGPGMAMASGPR